MEILGIGPLELFFFLIIALIVLGPKDMAKAGKTLGRFLRRLVTSPTWHAVQETSRHLRYLPNRLMREAGVEEDIEELKQIGREAGIAKEAAMLRSLGKSISQVDDEVKEEAQLAAQDFSAWTTTATVPTEGQSQTGAAEPTNPAARAPGPAEAYTPASDADLNQPQSGSQSS